MIEGEPDTGPQGPDVRFSFSYSPGAQRLSLELHFLIFYTVS